jgi:hypothetical protein
VSRAPGIVPWSDSAHLCILHSIIHDACAWQKATVTRRTDERAARSHAMLSLARVDTRRCRMGNKRMRLHGRRLARTPRAGPNMAGPGRFASWLTLGTRSTLPLLWLMPGVTRVLRGDGNEERRQDEQGEQTSCSVMHSSVLQLPSGQGRVRGLGGAARRQRPLCSLCFVARRTKRPMPRDSSTGT